MGDCIAGSWIQNLEFSNFLALEMSLKEKNLIAGGES
jgi:hypothetical protein